MAGRWYVALIFTRITGDVVVMMMDAQRFTDCTSWVVSLISGVGSLLLLIEFARRPGLRERVMLRPLMYEVGSQLLRSIGLLIETSPLVFHSAPIGRESPALCSMLGALDQFSGVACYGWYTVIAFNAILALRASVERPAFTQPEKRRRIIFIEEIVVWSSAFLCVVPTALQGFVDSEQGYGVIEDTDFLRSLYYSPFSLFNNCCALLHFALALNSTSTQKTSLCSFTL